MGISYKDAFLIREFLMEDSKWIEIDGMKRPELWEFGKKKRWDEKSGKAKETLKNILKESYFDVNE